MGDIPIVTVAMPVRDALPSVSLAIRSILAQTFSSWELLIMDDGSRDASSQVTSHFQTDHRVRIIADGRRKGLAVRLNESLTAARGRYFARMDADDIAYPSRLATQYSFLECHPNVDLVGAQMLIIDEDDNALGERTAPLTHRGICRPPTRAIALYHPTFFGRLDWFRRYRYDPRALRCEDQDLLLRSASESVFANVPEVLLAYREDKVKVRSILTGRRSYRRALRRHFRGRPAAWIPAVAAQYAKGVVDAVAASTGTERTLLRHRCRPTTPGRMREWEDARTMLMLPE